MVSYDEFIENAEKALQTAKDKGEISETAIELINELQVHHAELEMQNEELKQSQQEISDLYNQYHELYNELPVGYFTLDKKGLIKNVNTKGADLLDLDKELIINRWFGVFIPPDEKRKFHQHLNAAAVKHITQEFGIQLKQDKKIFDAQMKIKPVALEKSNEKYWIIVEDISKRKLAEEKVLKAKEDWEHTFDAVPNLIAIVDLDYHICRLNQAMAQRLGVKIEDCIGRKCYELIHGTHEPPLICPHKFMLEDGQEHTLEVHEDKLDGEFINSVSPIHNENKELIGSVHVLSDITKRKQIEEALRLNEAMFKVALDNSSIAVFSQDRDLRYTWIYNPAPGFKIEDILMKRDDEIYLPEDAEIFTAIKRDVIARDVIRRDEVITHRPPSNGGDLVQDMTTAPLHDASGALVGIVCAAMNITDLKKAEEHKQELLEKEQLLSEEFQVSNEELINTQEELENTISKLEISNQELEQFAYIASHDLQEPLRMVASFTQLLEMRYKDKLDKEGLEYIDFAVDGAKRMQLLINDLLAYSRVTSNPQEFEEINLDKALEEVLFNLEIVIEENQAIITRLPLPKINADYSQMVQLFQNLIGNAIKYRTQENPQIHISAQESRKEWLFSIKDNGIGIDPEHQKKIFYIFNRLHTREEYEGTGIGLAICKRIIDRHVGRIWVESEEGEGSTFYFTIPKQK